MSALPWIKLSNDLPDHPKSLHLCALLRQERAWTHLVQLWLWASKHAPDGDLSRHPEYVIERAAGWTGDPGALLGAMEEAGFLDSNRTLGGWKKHQGAHIRKKERDANRRKSDDTATQTSDTATTPRRKSAAASRKRANASREIEMESEIEREKDPTSSGSADGPRAEAHGPPDAAPAKPRTGRLGAEDFNALLEQPYQGYARALDFFVAEFPAYDGKNGRLALRAKLALLKDWFVRKAKPSQQWTTPLGVHNALSADYGRYRPSYEQDQRKAGGGQRFNGNPRQTVPVEDKKGNAITLPDAYVWDRHDAAAWDMGKRWTGKGWAS